MPAPRRRSGRKASSRRAREAWGLPELLRIRGEIHRRCGEEVEADANFERAFLLADDQGALAWKLRTAISWLTLQPDFEKIREKLSDSFDAFREGFEHRGFACRE
jgi:hypothetical protein